MKLDFTYICSGCEEEKKNSEMTSFLCESCGEFMRLKEPLQMTIFKPYYSEEMKEYIRTPRDEAVALKKNKLSYLRDHKKLDKRLSDIRKNKEEVRAEILAKDGIKYKKGSDTRFDITLKRFVPKNPNKDQAVEIQKDLGKATKKNLEKSRLVALAASIFLLISSPLEARIDMVEYTVLEINGKSYDVPKANKDYVQELYWLKKCLAGDKDALDLFVGDQDYKDLFIGDEFARWVRVYKDGRAEVTEYPHNI